jgi:hypothetical protein
MKSKRQLLLTCFLPLVLALVIYVLFRSRDTIVNKLIYSFWATPPPIWRLRYGQWLVYNLPGALWMYAFLWFGSFSRSRLLSLLPLGMALGIELLQLLHITDGTFDILDVGFYLLVLAVFAALGGFRWWRGPRVVRSRRRSFAYKALFISFMVIVILSDVWTKP